MPVPVQQRANPAGQVAGVHAEAAAASDAGVAPRPAARPAAAVLPRRCAVATLVGPQVLLPLLRQLRQPGSLLCLRLMSLLCVQRPPGSHLCLRLPPLLSPLAVLVLAPVLQGRRHLRNPCGSPKAVCSGPDTPFLPPSA